jgi:oligosaccharyltransferase complex subunit delta (ribophorin II)
LRYRAQPEINHIFRADPRSPPKIISAIFTLAVLGTLPLLLGSWLALGANVNHVAKALAAAPVAHVLFFGAVLALEGIFFLYYTSWNLFQTLPAVGIVGAVAFLSGSRALREVQARRVAGLR